MVETLFTAQAVVVPS